MQVQISRYRLPLVKPLQLKTTRLNAREGFLLHLTDAAGHTGWGEIAPLAGFSRATTADVLKQLLQQKNRFKQWALGEITPDALLSPKGSLYQRIDQLNLYPSVRFGVEQALLFLQAARCQQPASAFFTEDPAGAVELNSLLMGGSPSSIEESARQMIAAGYSSVKFKVGRGPLAKEAQHVRLLSQLLKGKASLRLDANRAWSLEEALCFAGQISGSAVEYIEEPLADPQKLPAFAQASALPVALDESLETVSPGQLPDHSYAAAVVLKPMLRGGLAQTTAYLHEARRCEMTAVISASFESGVGLLGLASLAAGFQLQHTPAGLDTYRWLKNDLLNPALQIKDGQLGNLSRPLNRWTLNSEFLEPVS